MSMGVCLAANEEHYFYILNRKRQTCLLIPALQTVEYKLNLPRQKTSSRLKPSKI